MIFRFKFTVEFNNELLSFAKVHQYDDRPTYKENWDKWLDANEDMIMRETLYLKSNGYDKVSTKLAPNFLLKFIGIFDREARSMRAFIGKTYNGDASSTMKIFNWKPISFEKTVLDTAKSIKGLI